jgi:hypothetical protein
MPRKPDAGVQVFATEGGSPPPSLRHEVGHSALGRSGCLVEYILVQPATLAHRADRADRNAGGDAAGPVFAPAAWALIYARARRHT